MSYVADTILGTTTNPDICALIGLSDRTSTYYVADTILGTTTNPGGLSIAVMSRALNPENTHSQDLRTTI